MFIKIGLFILYIVIHSTTSQITKCTDAPPDACGPNANCFDDKTDINYQRLNGPYCKCSDNSYGKPPTCKLRCEYNSDCESNEFCDSTGSKECIEGCKEFGSCKIGEFCDISIRKCTKGCKYDSNCNSDESCDEKSQKCEKLCVENSCGENGKCLAEFHTKYCTCEDGYLPDNEVKRCRKQNYPEEKANCENSCNYPSKCSEKDDNIYCYCSGVPDVNPIQFCVPVPSFYPGQPQPFKPTTENQVFSLQTVMILTG